MSTRRRRRSPTKLLAERTLIEIKQKRLAFLRDVSQLLSDALGFTVRVSLVKPNAAATYSPAMKRAARMSAKDARKQMRDAFAPFTEELDP